MVKLKDAELAKEEVQARARKERCEERRVRFLNARERTIGIDKEYLDKQVKEREEQRLKAKEEEAREATYQHELCDYLDQRELLKEDFRNKYLSEVNATLKEQVELPKNNAIGMCGPLDFNVCGISSVQIFEGEDNGHDERKREHQNELRQWCAQQEQEKQDRLREEAKAEENYAEYISSEDAMRCELENEKERSKTESEASVKIENIQLATRRKMERMSRERAEKDLEEAESSHVQSSPFFCEDTDYAKSVTAHHRVRPDHFKGFSKDQVKTIYEENDQVLAAKTQSKKDDEEMTKYWDQQQWQVGQLMDERENEKEKAKLANNRRQLETLKIQCEQLKEKQRNMEKDRFGSISNDGFFQGFGTSCR